MDEITKLGGEGIIDETDIPSLKTQRKRVWTLMLDDREHSGPEIVKVSGGSEGLRRLREFREVPGIEIEKRRDVSGRFFWYWLVKEDEPEVQSDFWTKDQKRKDTLNRLIG